MASLRRQLKDLQIRPKKSLGQHFVQDPNILRKITEEASLQPEDVVLEIGAGLGSLTVPLAERVRKVYALEVDPRLAGVLREQFSGDDRVEVILADALRFDFAPLFGRWPGKMKVVANLPYEISSPMIFRLLKERDHFSLFVLMLQLEVARRLTAEPGTKDYGALGIWSRLYCRVHISFPVGPRAFLPPPKVQSAVVKFEVLPEPRLEITDPGVLEKVIRSAFTYRRKTLSNALQNAGFPGAQVARALDALGVSRMIRGEALTLDQFAALANDLSFSPLPGGSARREK